MLWFLKYTNFSRSLRIIYFMIKAFATTQPAQYAALDICGKIDFVFNCRTKSKKAQT
jgi:hypothetical protein